MKSKTTLAGILLLAFTALALATPAFSQISTLNINWTVNLVGSASNGGTAMAEYHATTAAGAPPRIVFSVVCQGLRVTDGTALDVFVAGKNVGSFATASGAGGLLLTGPQAPIIQKGTVVTINMKGGPAIFVGRF